MRLIDADRFKENILSGLYIFCQENKEDIARAIDEEPTVDLWQMRQEATKNALKKAEVLYKRPQGEWKLDDTEQFCYCDQCEDTYYPRPLDPSWNYCPQCGAFMRDNNNV